MTSIVEFRSVSKNFTVKRKTIPALRNVSFRISEGEVFGFVGPNGAGKSTTIKVLLNIINRYEGQVEIHGLDARDSKSRRSLSYVPEAASLYDQFTPMEVLKTALRMHGIRKESESRWCMDWLERFSVAEYSTRKIRNLSKGNVQRVALAHAMVTNPAMLVLDEPLSGLDPVGRKDVVDILHEYKSNGGAIFFTSHVLHDVERIADRFGFINEGRLLTTQSPRDLISVHTDKFLLRYQSDVLNQGIEVREGEFEVELSQEEIPVWMNELNTYKGQLLDVKPLITLEKVFFDLLNSNNQPMGFSNSKSTDS